MNACQVRKTDRGSALILTMIMALIVMGIVSSLFIMVNVADQSSRNQSDHLEALEDAEIGLNKILAEIRSTTVETRTINGDDHKVGYVGQKLLDAGSVPAGQYPITYTVDIGAGDAGHTCTVSVRSAYFSWQQNKSDYESNNVNFLREVTKSEREDDNASVFDVYEIIAGSWPKGEHSFRRGVAAIVELRKANAAIPSALYIDQDPDPVWNGNSWNVNGKDHAMVPNGAVHACVTCGGTGQVTAPAGQCATCAGTGEVECPTCRGKGKLRGNVPCPDCAASGTIECAACGGTGATGGGVQTCPDCGGTGQDPGGGGGGQPVEEDFLTGSGSDKPAVGYNGQYSDLGLTSQEEDQIETFEHDEDGNPVTDDQGDQVTTSGQGAYTNTKIDLRQLAASFVGGPPTDPLQPDMNRVDHQDIGSRTAELEANGPANTPFEVTYIGPDSDAGTVSAQTQGAGVLIIDGDVHISGKLSWYGLVIVLGDMQMSGGGNGIHIFGSIMVESESVVAGNADIWWSQDAIDKVMADCDPRYAVTVTPLVWRTFDKAEVQNILGKTVYQE